MTTITRKQLRERAREKVKSLEFAVTQTAFADNRAELEEELELSRIALASLEAEPVAWIVHSRGGDQLTTDANYVANAEGMGGIHSTPVYAAPPAPVSVPDEVNVLLNHLEDVLPDDAFNLIDVKTWNSVSMLSRPDVYRTAMLQGAEPVSNRDELPGLIEGMEVSVDVSTCDTDAGHRYFGTVTEVSELDGAKNGYILLVQDAEPNFKHTGNSPVIPEGCKLVPVDPTPEMQSAAAGAIRFDTTPINKLWTGNAVYRAMLAAAPQQEA